MCSRQSYLRSLDGQERPLHSEPLCLLSLCEASRLLKLEIGSWGDSSKCSVPTLGGINRLCLPTFLHDRQVPGQDHLGKSPLDPRNTPLEITSLVPSHLVNVGGDTAECRDLYKGKDAFLLLSTSSSKSVHYEVLSFVCLTINKASWIQGRVATPLSC